MDAVEKYCHQKPVRLLNIKADYTKNTNVGISQLYASCKKKRYLRNQILSVRNSLSEEEWLRYAGFRFGTHVRYEPFLNCGFFEVSFIRSC